MSTPGAPLPPGSSAVLPYAPAPWVVHRSRRTGEPYFFHPQTQKAYSYDATLPAGWAWGRDSEHGPRFFVRLATGERRATPPAAAEADGPAPLAGTKRLSGEMRGEGGSVAEQTGEATAAGVVIVTPGGCAAKRPRADGASTLSRLPVVLELLPSGPVPAEAPLYATASLTGTNYQLGLWTRPCVLQLAVEGGASPLPKPAALLTSLHATPGARLMVAAQAGSAHAGLQCISIEGVTPGSPGDASFTCVVVPPGAPEAAAVGGAGLLLALRGGSVAAASGGSDGSPAENVWRIATVPTGGASSTPSSLSWRALPASGDSDADPTTSLRSALLAAGPAAGAPYARFQVLLEAACLQALCKGNIAPAVAPALAAAGVPPSLRVEAGAGAGAGHRGGAAGAWFEGAAASQTSSLHNLPLVCKSLPWDPRVASEAAALYAVAGLEQAAGGAGAALGAFALGAATGCVPPLAILRSFGPGGVVTPLPGPPSSSTPSPAPEARVLMARLTAPLQRWVDDAPGATAAVGPLRAGSLSSPSPLDAVTARGGAVSAGFLLAAWRRMLTALRCLHGAHLLYADFHPGNVMITTPATASASSPLVSLIDFGSARPLAGSPPTYTGPTRGGRWDYMAPEQFGPERWGTGPVVLTPAADLFAAAATMLGVAAGAPPFGPPPGAKLTLPNTKEHVRRTRPEALAAHVAATLDSFTAPAGGNTSSSWRGPLQAAFMACLAADPAARPQTAQAVLDMLAAADAAI